MTEEKIDSVEKYKELGNAAVKNGKFEEAIIHYTCAIKMEPINSVLYSNRSLAFLKVHQYYLSLEDAIETIKLNPSWAKGYFRKAEVEFATYKFTDAFKSYQKALQLQPNDTGIVTAMTKVLKEQQKDLKADAQVPWVGGGIGIIVGVLIVIADYLFTKTPTLTHPILMVTMAIAISLTGYGIARAYRYYIRCQRDSLLELPTDLLSNENDSEKVDPEGKSPSTHKYTKSQARQRYKKGKA